MRVRQGGRRVGYNFLRKKNIGTFAKVVSETLTTAQTTRITARNYPDKRQLSAISVGPPPFVSYVISVLVLVLVLVVSHLAVACWREAERAGAKLCFVSTLVEASGRRNFYSQPVHQ